MPTFSACGAPLVDDIAMWSTRGQGLCVLPGIPLGGVEMQCNSLPGRLRKVLVPRPKVTHPAARAKHGTEETRPPRAYLARSVSFHTV